MQYYENVEEFILEDDIPETDIQISGWKKGFRMRGLTFGQMEKINKNALDPDTGKLKSDEFAYWTIVEGIVRPRITIDNARKMQDKNGELVRELVDNIWRFSKFSRAIFEQYMKAQEELEELQEKERKLNEPKTKPRKRIS